jgi:hypothetical protein
MWNTCNGSIGPMVEVERAKYTHVQLNVYLIIVVLLSYNLYFHYFTMLKIWFQLIHFFKLWNYLEVTRLLWWLLFILGLVDF